MRWFGIVALLLASLGCGTETKEPIINRKEPIKMSNRPFHLSANEYWTDPEKNLSQLATERLRGMMAGIVIDCPESVAIDEHQTLPLLVYQSGSTQDLHLAPFRDHGIVAAFEPTEGVLRAAFVVPQTGVKRAPGKTPSPGFSGSFHQADLRATLSLPWKPATYLVSAHHRDQISNRLSVEIVGAKSSYDDPEVAKVNAARLAKRPPREIAPPAGTPGVRFGRVADSLEAPAEPGFAMDAERVVTLEEGTTATVRVAFRLKVAATDVIRTAAGTDEEQRPLVTAVVPLALMILGSESPGPQAIPLVAPSFDDVVDGTATGYVELDLRAMGHTGTRAQTLFLYAFGGEAIAGPALMGLIVPE